MNKKLYIIGLLLVLLITPFFMNYNSLPKEEYVEEFTASLEAKVPQLLAKYNIPGAAISIIEDGEVKWVGTFGYGNIDEEIEITRDTVFQVASISKSATAVGIMKLVEEGRIELDAPIESYVTRWSVPESEYNNSHVTVKNLLSHTAGLSVGGGYPGYHPSTQLPTIEESLTGVEGGSRPVEIIYEPGTKFSYSGGGYSLLQLLIEEVTGKTFNDYMKTNVLKAADMNNSSFQWEEFLQDKTATAYDKDLNQLPNYLFAEKAAAGLYTTIDDMNKFMITQIDSYSGIHEGSLLSKETMQQMHAPVMQVEGLEGFIYQKTALGHFVNMEEDGIKLISHDGGNKGWKANFTMIPDRESGIVILTNGDNGTYLLNEVLNAWQYTTLGTYRSFDKLQHTVSAIIYSLTSILMLWSVIRLYILRKEVKNGVRRMTLLEGKLSFVIKCSIITALLYITYLFKTQIVSILSFIDPSVGNIIFIALFIRVAVGITQIIFLKSKIDGFTKQL
ncbi:MAG: beta-lactamase family protein [Clostridiaceae bacterium]|nr:beta-lactamase family protein [Clostridiaceae bacterium]